MSTVAPLPRHQRARGIGRIATQTYDGKTRLSTLFQEGCAKIRLPHTHNSSLEAVLINTAGGLTGGDDVAWQANAAPGARMVLTTQACEKVYRSMSGVADLSSRGPQVVVVEPGGTVLGSQEPLEADSAAAVERARTEQAAFTVGQDHGLDAVVPVVTARGLEVVVASVPTSELRAPPARPRRVLAPAAGRRPVRRSRRARPGQGFGRALE